MRWRRNSQKYIGGNPESNAPNPGKLKKEEGLISWHASQRSRKMRTEKCPVNGFSTEATFFLQGWARSRAWGTNSDKIASEERKMVKISI